MNDKLFLLKRQYAYIDFLLGVHYFGKGELVPENFLTVQVAEVLITRCIGCLISAIDLVMQNPASPGIRHIVRHSQQEQVGDQMTQKSFPC